MLTMLTGSDGQKCFGEMFPKKLKDLCIYRKIVDLSSLWGRRWGMQVSPAHPVSGMLGASTMTTRFFFAMNSRGEHRKIPAILTVLYS